MKCRECNAELPRSAHRCRHCGRPILHEKIWNNKRLRALFIGIIIVLIAVGAGIAAAALAVHRKKRTGGCCGCSGCQHCGACAGADAKRKRKER